MASKNEIIEAVNDVIGQYNMPLTLRQIYYRLVSRNIIENKLNSYKALSRILVNAREQGQVPEDMIEDRARTTYGGDGGYPGPEVFIQEHVNDFRNCWENYTKPLWDTQDTYLEVWVEKDALSRLVSEVAGEYRVMTCVGRGYSSYTYVREAVNRFIPVQDEKECIILYFGDHDPSGLDITRDLGRRIADYGAPDVEVRRVALLPEQIRQYSLPPAPVKMSDARAASFVAKHGNGVVELDALEPPVLQEMISQAIIQEINTGEWNRTIQEIKEEREQVKKEIERLTEGYGRGRADDGQ